MSPIDRFFGRAPAERRKLLASPALEGRAAALQVLFDRRTLPRPESIAREGAFLEEPVLVVE